MRNFNSRSILIVVSKNYNKTFPNRQGRVTVFSHGIMSDKSPERLANMFYCYDPDYGLIGFAIHFNDTKILRYYNHEGTDVGLETDMHYTPPKKGIQKIKVKG